MDRPTKKPTPMPVGKVIRYFRKHLFRVNGLPLNQSEFGQRCFKIENAILESYDKENGTERRFGTKYRLFANSPRYAAEKIGELENDSEVTITPNHLSIIEQAFNVPEGFLSTAFMDTGHIESQYRALNSKDLDWRELLSPQQVPFSHQQTRATASAAESPAGLSEPVPATKLRVRIALLKPANASFPILQSSSHLTSGRVQKMDQLDARIQDSIGRDNAVLILHGNYGCGKTFLVSRWWYDRGRKAFQGAAIRIECADKSSSDVIREISRYLFSEEHEIADFDIPPQSLPKVPVLIWLDQLQYQPGLSYSSMYQVSPIHEIIRLLAPLFNSGAAVTLILSVQYNLARLFQPEIADMLPLGVRVHDLAIDPLSPEEGAELFQLCGCGELSQVALEKLASQLGGLPICIVAAATQLSRIADQTEREQYCVELLHDGRDKPLSDFVLSSIRRFDADFSAVYKAKFHPEALIRLLALLPGPSRHTFIDRIIRRLDIQRLADFDARMVKNLGTPFTVFVGDKIDLHPMVRSIVREQLNLIAAGLFEDKNTNREEIIAIHAAAAELRYDFIREGMEDITYSEIEAIEGAVYHLIAFRDMLLGQRPRQAVARIHTDATERVFTRNTTPGEITRFCYQSIAQKYLLSSRNRITRFLGQYETKAKILINFFRDRRVDKGAPYLEPHETLTLLVEIAVCFLHSGRLKLSALAIGRAKENIPLAQVLRTCRDIDELTDPSSGRRKSSDWVRLVDLLSIESLIEVRLGIPVAHIQRMLDPLRQVAIEVHDACRKGNFISRFGADVSLIRACVKILARYGHVLTLKGQLTAALNMFEMAELVARTKENIPRVGGDPAYLSGEAARQYAFALLHYASGDPSRKTEIIAQAAELVETNIEKYEEKMAYLTSRPQNDVIPFYILRATVARQEGRLAEAMAILEQVETHEYVSSGECTFMSLIELKMEKFRILAARNELSHVHAIEIGDLARRLDAEHHKLSSAEVMLFESINCSTIQERRRKLNQVEGKLHDLGVRLYDAEIARARRIIHHT